MSEQKTKLTRQDLFNNAWQAFVVEKAGPSIDASGIHCLYLSPSGCRCAIGVSIPSDTLQLIVKSGWNNSAIDSLMEDSVDAEKLFSYEDIDFMKLLQFCHDRAAKCEDYFSKAVKERLLSFATDNDLQIPQ